MVKEALVLFAATAIVPRLRRRSAAQRHALWLAAIVAATVMPLLSSWLPAWEPTWAQRATDAWTAAFDSGAITLDSGDVVVRATGVEPGPWAPERLLLALWVVVSAVLFGQFALQALRLRRLALRASPAPARVDDIASHIAHHLALPAPRVTCTDAVAMPLAWGLRRAHVLLPRVAHHWRDERIWAVCAHEIAHVSRGDWLAHVLAECACRIYWFNPLFWLARKQLGRESERAADDVVLSLGARPADYAAELLNVVRELQATKGLAPTVAMAGGSGFEPRVAALLNAVVNRARLPRRHAAALLAIVCVVAAPLAAIHAGTPPSIRLSTSTLPASAGAEVRDLPNDTTEPISRIRVAAPRAGDVAPAVADYTTPPLYSEEARRNGIEGVVTLQARIEADGRVRSLSVSSGPGWGLEENALVAARQWRFRPGEREGAAVAMDALIEVAFSRRTDAINTQIANDMVDLVGPGVTPPQAINVVRPAPLTPRESGAVVLDVVLLETGRPRILRILRSLSREADDAAVRAFEQWRFTPALRDGSAVRVRVNAEVRFHG